MEKVIFNMDEGKFFDKCVRDQNVPRNDALKQVILKKIMINFQENRIYSEQEVNLTVKKYFEDYTLIRRELINFGYMQRDPAKSEYWVIKKELLKEDYIRITRLKQHAIQIGVINI